MTRVLPAFSRLWLLIYALVCAQLCLSGALQAAHAEENVRMGFYVKVTRDLSRAEVQAALDFWAEELGKKFDVPTQVRFYDDMPTLRRDFDSGLVNFVITSAMDFVRYFKVEELAEGFASSLHVDHTLKLATRADSDFFELNQMADKRIAVLKDDELSEIYLETLCLRQYRRPCKEVFAVIDPIKTSNKLVMQLFFGKADLILTHSSGMAMATELNPQIGKAIRVVRQFPVRSRYFGLFSHAVDKTFRTRALKHIPTMHQNPRGRQVLQVFHIERLELVQETELLPFLRLNQEYESLLAGDAKTRKSR